MGLMEEPSRRVPALPSKRGQKMLIFVSSAFLQFYVLILATRTHFGFSAAFLKVPLQHVWGYPLLIWRYQERVLGALAACFGVPTTCFGGTFSGFGECLQRVSGIFIARFRGSSSGPSRYLHPVLGILAVDLKGTCKVFGGCLQHVWKVPLRFRSVPAACF